MLKVGITGGIGSGKSTVAKVFSVLGIPVYDADAASKRLYETDLELMASLKQHFGEDIYEGRTLNRKKLAALVFNDPAQLEQLNRLAHPPTIRDAETWMQQQTAPYLIKEAALLFESGSAAGLDCIIGVSAPKHLRINRVMKREGLTREEVLQRMHRQIDEEIKMKLFDFVLVNNEADLLLPQVIALHRQLLQLAESNEISANVRG